MVGKIEDKYCQRENKIVKNKIKKFDPQDRGRHSLIILYFPGSVHHPPREDQLRGPGGQRDDQEDQERGQDPRGGKQHQQEPHGPR